MTNHPSDETIRAYLAKELPVDRMTEVILHLEQCPDCRQKVEARTNAFEPRDNESGLLDDELDFHLSFDEHLRPFVDGAADEATIEIVESHAAVCEHCAMQVSELRSLAAELGRAPSAEISMFSKLSAIFTPRMKLAAAFGAIAIVAAGIAIAILQDRPAIDGAAVEVPVSESPVPTIIPVDDQTTELRPSPTAQPSPTNKNTEDPLAKYAEDLAALSPAMRATLEEALRTGREPRSRGLELLGSAPKLRGSGDSASARPNREVVADSNPLISWPNATETRWKIEIYDDAGNVVAEAANQTADSWKPSKSLPRGRVYRWQATPETTTNPNAKPFAGSFYILDAATLNDLNRLKSRSPELYRLAKKAAGLRR